MPCTSCSNILYIKDKINTCSGSLIKLGFQAAVQGEYKLVVDFLGTEVTIKKTFAVNDQFDFPATGLNEEFEYLGKLYSPNGQEVAATIGSVTYNCFSFKTSFKVQL